MTGKQRAWILVDFGSSAFAATILAAVFPVYFPTLLPIGGVFVSWFGVSLHFDALSIWSYAVASSIFVTVLLSPLLGAWADRAGMRKKLFGVFTILGVVGTTGLFVFTSWVPALVCFSLANIGFSASNVFYNSLLASVAEEHEWNAISLSGFAWGYLGGGLLLALNLVMILKFDWFGFVDQSDGLRWAFLSVAIWWFVFSLPALLMIDEKMSSAASEGDGALKSWWIKILKTLKDILTDRMILLFILSFAFFNEGVQTVIAMASIFGKEAVGLSDNILVGTLLMIQILGLPFTLLMSKAVIRFGARNILSAVLVAWVGIVSYAYHLQTGHEFVILGILVSVVLGVSQALPRSLFQAMIPKGREAEYFSFFALSGKMTSFLGPFVFGLVHQVSGNPRLSILMLSVFFIIGLILFRLVPAGLER